MQTVQDTIEQLDLAFSTIAKPQHIDGCPCCIDKKEIVVLLAKSLRTITPKELSPYASSAFLTVGERTDYLYFLPRILEISATDTSWWPDPEVTGRAIRSSNTDLWNEAQLSCLKKYLEVLIGSFIALGLLPTRQLVMCYRPDEVRCHVLSGSDCGKHSGCPFLLRAECRQLAPKQAVERLLGTAVLCTRHHRELVLLARHREDTI